MSSEPIVIDCLSDSDEENDIVVDEDTEISDSSVKDEKKENINCSNVKIKSEGSTSKPTLPQRKRKRGAQIAGDSADGALRMEEITSDCSDDEVETNQSGDNDDVEVVDSSIARPQIQPAAGTSRKRHLNEKNSNGNDNDNGSAHEDDDEELELVGEANVTRLPHNRQNCLDCRFVPGGNASANASFCDLCYCFVCDKLASECENWIGGEKGTLSSDSNPTGASSTAAVSSSASNSAEDRCKNHCLATDVGHQSAIWKAMRKATKDGGDVQQAAAGNYRGLPDPPAANGGMISISAHTSAASLMAHMERVMLQMSRNRRHSAPSSRTRRVGSSGSRRGGRGGGGAIRSAARSRGNAPRRRSGHHDHQQRIRTQAMLEELYD